MAGMYSLSTDSIVPKNAPLVTIHQAYVLPNVTTSTSSGVGGPAGATQTVYCTVSAFAEGDIVTLAVNEINFTGGGSTLSFTAIPGLDAPAETLYTPIIISIDGTRATGYVSITTGKVISFAATAAGGAFTDTGVCIIYPFVLKYQAA